MQEMQYYNYNYNYNNYRQPEKSRLKVASKICYIISIIAILVSAVSLIILATKDYTKNKKYEYSSSILGIPFGFSITLKDDEVAIVSTSALGETESGEVKYYVEDGVLYMESLDDESLGFQKVGKISSTKVVVENSEYDLSMALVCESAKIQQNVSIAVISVGGVVLLAAIIMTAISKKNKNFI